MKILVATDAAPPQVNGVVRTYLRLAQELERSGVTLSFIRPDDFVTLPQPFYREIRMALPAPSRMARLIEAAAPDYVHIATEGPVGWVARHVLKSSGWPFTTSYHTKFPEYASALFCLPEHIGYRLARHFHAAGAGMMVATRSLAAELDRRGFKRILPWSRGVDTEVFRPRPVRLFGREKPVFLCVGRVSREKNIEAFLTAYIAGVKVVVGDGPWLKQLRSRFPDVIFTGARYGEELAEIYASADVFVFPSRTDTFGLVLLEAMASGLPVAAFPVTGPIDIVCDGVTGILNENLALAATRALSLDRQSARAHAETHRWSRVADQFVANIKLACANGAGIARCALQSEQPQRDHQQLRGRQERASRCIQGEGRV